MESLQTLSGIPGVQLKFECTDNIDDLDHPFIAQWLKQHVQLISRLTMGVHISDDRLKLRDSSEATAPCRSIDLYVCHSPNQVVDLADLAPLAASLNCLTCQPKRSGCGILRGASALHNMSQLTSLSLDRLDLGSE
jgi:hypothetical protein